MRGFHPKLPLGVALSGGADSTALLLLCAHRWPGQVHALHINHGLQSAAVVFQDHCQRLCASLGVPLRTQAVDAAHARGQSPEDAARIARYQGLCGLARADAHTPQLASIVLAQHADDQAETLLLALGRGAGLAGLSAMPAHWMRAGIAFHRPLLEVAGAHIRDWLAHQKVDYVNDPSNAEERYTRNRIRARLMPSLQTTFPHFRDAFARTAAHAAQAQSLLDEVAAQDLCHVLRGEDQLPLLAALQAMSRARQANALRYWLKSGFGVIPSSAQLRELQNQIAACVTRGHRIRIKVGSGYVQRQGPVLGWYNPQLLPHAH